VALELSDFKPSAFKRLLTRTKVSLRLGKSDTPKILQLVDKANILGVMKNQNNMLVVYNGQLSYSLFVYLSSDSVPDLGCFVKQDGKPTHPNFYTEWERRATSYAHYGLHLLLFSPGYIEVRHIETGKLVRMVAVNDLRLLCSGWTEWPKLVAAITRKENDGSYTERLVELGYSGN
jgi:CNH domain